MKFCFYLSLLIFLLQRHQEIDRQLNPPPPSGFLFLSAAVVFQLQGPTVHKNDIQYTQLKYSILYVSVSKLMSNFIDKWSSYGNLNFLFKTFLITINNIYTGIEFRYISKCKLILFLQCYIFLQLACFQLLSYIKHVYAKTILCQSTFVIVF